MRDKFNIYQYDGEIYAIRRQSLYTVWGMCISNGKPYIAYPYAVYNNDDNNTYNHYDFRIWLLSHKAMMEDTILVDLFPVLHEGKEVVLIAEDKEIEYTRFQDNS